MGISDYIRGLRTLIGTELLLLPSATTAIFDEAGRLLVGRSVDTGRWIMIGGAIDPGESPAAAAIREAREETGLTVGVTSLIGVYSGPDFEVMYPNGDRTLYVISLFEARPLSGTPIPDGEGVIRTCLRHPGRGFRSADGTRLAVSDRTLLCT